ncbi:hypothetical protein [Roseospira visakhapatnamensis]|uniref:Phage repressor protein C with HTH and peptisase S24 domain n=1 Tax=Roseospira visakhapatnamensis TaxID=390880 RepID=A0A7W6RBP1_9PROT|nr:hypothetical protein [Roseospira visakhapatnamensis]MBB4265407.1 phage repressor protein C with HTH and peptisase S24 domain [Roseospira visakhapatnamensis]
MNPEIDTDAGFRARLGELVADAPPFQWAKQAGVPPGSWDRAWNKGAIPKAPHLIRIAEHGGVTLDWLLTGDGPMHRDGSAEQPKQAVDTDLLRDCIEVLHEELDLREVKLTPTQEAEAISLLYDLARPESGQRTKPVDRGVVVRILRMAG